jgi:hypothetical protein
MTEGQTVFFSFKSNKHSLDLHLVEQLSSLHQLQDQKVVLIALAKADQLDDVGVVGSSHDLNLLEDVRTLHRQTGCCQLYP